MNKQFSSFIIIILLSIIQSNPVFSYPFNPIVNFTKNDDTSCPGPYPEDGAIELTTFPVDLDSLYCQDNLSLLNDMLNDIGNGSTIWPITPWGGHFHSSHPEGADKWYMYSYNHTAIYAPLAGQMTELEVLDYNVLSYNNEEFIGNTKLTIDVGNDFDVAYDHIDILKSIYDEKEATGSYTFTEGQLLGYNHNWSEFCSIDFHLMYKTHNICPLKFFSNNIQTEIMTYYNLTYERAKLCGYIPESNICTNHTCEIENTVWGVWEYNTGPYDEEFYNTDLFRPNGFWTFFNRNFTNPETFYRSIIPNHHNLTDDSIGIFADAFPSEISEYLKLNHNMIKLAGGDYSVGIIELINSYSNDWGSVNTSVFAKFSILKNDVGAKDDVLTLEFFPDLLSAQAGFTANNLTLTRFYHYGYLEPPSGKGLSELVQLVISISAGVLGVLIVILIPVIIIHKRKKNNNSNK